MVPTPGRIVLYTLGENDADVINKSRKDFNAHRRGEDYRDTGYVAHVGNDAHAGDICPAVIVRVFGDSPAETTVVNLKVLLDGDDTYWATSRSQGTEPWQWHEPPRA